MTFARRLKKARKDKGLSQQNLADVAGISLRSIQNYEAGLRMPNSLAIVQRIAEVLQTSATDLLGSSESISSDVSSKREVADLLAEIKGLFAGGELPEKDKDAVLKAVIDAYWDAKGSQS